MSKVYIGTSGWQYEHWKGVFYPPDLPQKEWLRYYARYFDTVEVNATFYHQMKRETFEKWRETVGPDFTFAVKGNRFITHIKRLKDCREPLERFFEAAIPLGDQEKNVILWQLPPRFQADPQRLEKFLDDFCASAKKFRVSVLQAFEFRDKSWLNGKIYKLLKEYNCGFVIQDSPNWPIEEVVTASFVYLRFHGRESLYASCYSKEELDFLSKKMKQWLKQGVDVYGYFNNDAQGYAIDNARTLKNFLGRD